jgi:hypothetical protein
MFSWFKKKQKVEQVVEQKLKQLPVKEYTYICQLEAFEIGRILMELSFKDSRKFKVWYYGNITQHEPILSTENCYLGEVYINSSKQSAEEYLKNFSSYAGSYSRENIFVDDIKNPKRSMFGELIEMKILKTENYLEEFTVTYKEEVK